MELELKLEDGLSGWVLVEAHLDPRFRNSYSSLRLRRQSRPGKVEEIPLPVFLDGRIVELIELPGDAGGLTWRPPDNGQFDASQIRLRRIGWIERTVRFTIRVVRTYLRISDDHRQEAGLTPGRALLDPARAYRVATAFRVRYPLLNYPDWIERFDTLQDRDVSAIRAHIARFAARPRFHLLVSDNGEGSTAVAATVASLRAQLYDNFDYTVIDPTSPAPSLLTPHSSPIEPSPSLLTPHSSPAEPSTPHSSLDWIMLLHAGDALPPHALYWFACEIQARPDAAIVYSDDDTLDADGRRVEPRFKPEWSPAHLHSTHYIGAAAALRGSAVAKAGGVSAEDCRHGNYDLLLRVVDAAGEHVSHVPAVLLHRSESSPESQVTSYKSQDSSYKLQDTADRSEPSLPSQVSSNKLQDRSSAWEEPGWMTEALRAHLARNNIEAEVSETRPECRRVRYRLPDAPPLVSLIVPTRDAVALLRQCVDSVLEKTTYPRYEILVVDNQSTDAETLAWLEKIAAHSSVRVLRYDQPFNYSAINNFAAREARGEMLCLLNNDIEVISPNWLEEMTGHLLQKQVGIVGAKLLYPDSRVQHAGVTVGPGGCANHLHTHLERDAPGYCNRAVIAHDLSAVTAACLLTWRHLYESLGGLNEKELTIAFNDVDYCLRAQEAGYRVIFTPHAELVHHESATRGRDDSLRKRLRGIRELSYMRRHWNRRLKHDPYYNLNLSYWRADFSLTETQRIAKPWLHQ